MKRPNASDLLLQVMGNQILCSRGDFVLAYKIEYPEKYSQSEDDFETLHADWVKAFKNIPTGTIVVKSDVYTKEHYDSEILPAASFLQKATKKHFDGREYFQHKGFIFFVYTKINTLKNDTIKNPFVFPSLKIFNEEDIEVATFINEVEQAVEMLAINGQLQLAPLTPEEIRDFRDFYFNGFQADHYTDTEFEKEFISSDGKIAGVFALNNEQNFPEAISPAVEDPEFSNKEKDFYFYRGFLDCLGLTLRCPHIYNQIIFLDEHTYHTNTINKNLLHLKGGRKLSPENEAGAKRVQEYLDEVVEDPNMRYVRGHNNIIFWAENKAEFDAIKKRVSALLKSLDFKPTFVTRERLKDTFANSFFANASCLNNENVYLTDIRAAVSLFVFNSSYKNDDTGVVLNERIFNTPVVYDFWDERRRRKTSRNFAIIASTGRGKSFTAQHVLRQLIEQDVVTVIIDCGDSYLKLCKLFPPEDVAHFKYIEGESLGLNPFALSDPSELTALKIDEVCEFVWTLIKKDVTPTANERTSLRSIVNYYYSIEEDYTACSWHSFYTFVKLNKDNICAAAGIDNSDNSFFNVEEFIHGGKDFIDDGAYASLLKVDRDISTDLKGKKLVVFELDNIKDNKLLLSIELQAISETVHRTIWSDKTKRGIVFYDEFAKQIQFPEILNRVAYQTQAIRKQNGAAGIVLQTLNQLPETPEGRSIIDNIETFIFLEGSDYSTSEERLKLSRHDKSQMHSLASKFSGERKYSEVYIKANKYGNVYRIEVAPEVFFAYQTEGDVHEKIMRLYESSGSMENAINTYMSNL